MRILECSSRGDRRFSAMYATVEAFGKLDSIENHYQAVKRDVHGNPVSKGKYVDHVEFYGNELKVGYLTQWYNMLWIKYLDNNPDLVAYLRTFSDYSDMFKGKAINCQADSIRAYIKDRSALLSSCQELSDILRSLRNLW